MIRKLAHACLGVHDLNKSIDFYCRILGCRVVHEFINPAGELYGVFLYVNDGTFLEFFREQEDKVADGGLFRHLCFEVEDIHAFASYLDEKGFVVEVIRGRTDGVLQCWIEDPDANRIEFQQYDQGSLHYRFLQAESIRKNES